MEQKLSCPHCKSEAVLKFPCCGWLCMKCTRRFEDEDIKKDDKETSGSSNPS